MRRDRNEEIAPCQSNLTDPDSALMRRSDAHEYRQACNAQAMVCADGAQLILATNLVATSADSPSFAETILAHRHEGQVGDRRWQNPISKTQTNRRASVRHHQSAMGFTRLRLRGIANVATEWTLTALA